MTNSFTGGNLKDLGGETDGTLDTELLVLSTVDQISRDFKNMSILPVSTNLCGLTLFKVLDVAAGEGDADLVDFGSRNGGTCSIVFFFSFGDVTHFECRR